MDLYTTFSVLIVLSALFAYVNFRYIKLPAAIGLMFIALLVSIALVAIGSFFPRTTHFFTALMEGIDFSELLLEVMLSFMLFAGAIHIKLDELKEQRLPVILFSTFSVVISTFLVGGIIFLMLPLFGIEAAFIHCLLFGALISPTDPIAVLGILKEAKVPRSLEMKIAGESLFNDGVAVVVFLTVLQVAVDPGSFGAADIGLLFVREALGGIVLGLAFGYAGFVLMRSIDNYKVEVMLSLAVVMGGYSLAHALHVSGPLAMVAAGILIGNQGKRYAMSDTTAEYVDKFWELIDEILNAVLFVLIGLELLIIDLRPTYFAIGALAIVLILGVRYISIWAPAQLIRFKERISRGTIVLLTWGGLRGGISIALALSLRPEMGKELWVPLTYIVVAFSILVQGLTIGRLAKKVDVG
ncbi:MAG TPA: sodium:proton antiporter [Flavobacteriales bacterium]|nr:sodium:proton antiporter [Flavobacteriales bacterium]